MTRRLLLLFLLLWKPSASETIPTLRAQSLADAQVNLPADLNGRVAFWLSASAGSPPLQTKPWNESLLKDYVNDPNVAYYGGAVLAEVPALIRGMVIKGIRNQMSPAERAHFIPILQEASKWKDAAHFTAADDAYILLVGSTGQIEWRSHGPETPETYQALKQRVAELQQSTARKTR